MFEKHVNDRLIDHIEKYGLFLIFSMDSGLLDQLQIFLQLYMIELDISRDFDKVWYAALLSKLLSYGLSGIISGVILQIEET